MSAKKKKIILVVGGCRSGKSRYALELADAYLKKVFIATALPIDEEMKHRIETHRQERDASFTTIEEPYNLGNAIASLQRDVDIAIIDCLTVWLGNLMYKYRGSLSKASEIEDFFEALQRPPCSLILVSNEVGLGIIPADSTSRHFRDEAGNLNQRVAALANQVILTVCGIPLRVKK